MSQASAFLVVGHRGARGHAPENTLLSIDTGISLGAQMVEFDVQRVGDHLIVMHDLRLERTTNGHGLVADHDFESLRKLDAGRGQGIPTLQEVLDLVDQRVTVNIELKSADGTAALVAQLVRDYVLQGWPPSRFLVSSFHLPELYEFKQLAPEIPVGALLCGVPLDWAACATELGASSLNLSDEFVDARLVADAKSRGLQVLVYTVNNPDDALRLRKLGVDGVFTDYPDRILATMG